MITSAKTTRFNRQGMTLMEILVVLAIILILVGAVITAGKALQERASIDLTRSMLEVLDTALQQYYDDFGEFPFVTHIDAANPIVDVNPVGYLDDFIGPYVLNTGTIPQDIVFESGLALFYLLNQTANSRSIAAAVSESLITNKDMTSASVPITVTLNAQPTDLPRYIDAWKTSIRYQYISGTAFPILTSAGPDKLFDTGDDVTNK